ncbi:MAG: D-alanine--D-alanine ligase [Phycisphaerales bacterium]
MTTTVLVLAGGPDPEHEVSLQSAKGIADALASTGEFRVHHRVIGALSQRDLAQLEGDVIFPALHGRWGEGGPLQQLLERDGRPFVGCGPRAARIAIDKVMSKTVAQTLGVRTSATAILDPGDTVMPLELPFVVKPIFEGSTIGLHICRTAAEWAHAHEQSAASRRPCLIEPFVRGRELTVGVIATESLDALEALPVIQIIPADGLYDYDAKYVRNDTQYVVGEGLPASVVEEVSRWTLAIAKRMGVRHLCRADYLLDDDNRAWFLEINTMPGFTSHSLVPMAARAAGVEMGALCARLVRAALHEMSRA